MKKTNNQRKNVNKEYVQRVCKKRNAPLETYEILMVKIKETYEIKSNVN